jgi:restriction endonuclease Mrr
MLSILRTATEAYRTMTPTEFELFSAAVIIAAEKARGLAFVAHSGGTRDRGVDVRLRNAWGGNVIVQSKRYANKVGGEALLHFKGSIELHKAAYGFFVTTSTFTKEAQRVISSPGSRIYGIDSRKLDLYLRYHRQEIAQTYGNIQQRITGEIA